MHPDDDAWARDVARRFDLGRPGGSAVVAARGRQGVVRRLVTDRGSWAVKELLVPLDEADAALDGGFAETMVDRGVHAPQPVRTPDGWFLARVGDALVRVATWVDLHGVRTDLDPAAVGALFGTLHRDPLPAAAPVDPWFTDPVPDDEWADVATALGDAGAPFAAEFAESVPRLAALGALFCDPVDVQLCHRDLWADNVRGTPSGPIAVIDWDNSGAAEATQEVCVGLVEFCRRDDDRVRAFVRAYRAAGGPGRPSDREDFTMVLAQFGHFAHLAGRHWLAATSDDERRRARDWFHEEYDDPFGLRDIDRLLVATRTT